MNGPEPRGVERKLKVRLSVSHTTAGAPDSAAASESNPVKSRPDAGRPRTLGKYELIERIGSGGFGRVFKAWDPLIRRTVAIKTCEAASPEVRARFFREAQLAGNLQHPNITTVHELAIAGDMPYLVQEFLPGRDLSDMTSDPHLSVLEKLDILIGVASGLEHAHAAGVIHRDIKPANIRVLDSLAAKIMDFGIARSVRSESDLTRTGITIGSAAYMSPEQIRGEALDARTDLFSFGVLAYELFAGFKPFRDPEVGSLLDLVAYAEPEPLVVAAPDVPGSVGGIVPRALAKNRDERYASAEELRHALVAARHELLDAAGLSEAAVPEPIAVLSPRPGDRALTLEAIPTVEAPSRMPIWITAAQLLLAALGAGVLFYQ